MTRLVEMVSMDTLPSWLSLNRFKSNLKTFINAYYTCSYTSRIIYTLIKDDFCLELEVGFNNLTPEKMITAIQQLEIAPTQGTERQSLAYRTGKLLTN